MSEQLSCRMVTVNLTAHQKFATGNMAQMCMTNGPAKIETAYSKPLLAEGPTCCLMGHCSKEQHCLRLWEASV